MYKGARGGRARRTAFDREARLAPCGLERLDTAEPDEATLLLHMSDFVMTRKGAELLPLLEDDCGLTPDGAREFIETRTGLVYDPDALYGVAYVEPLAERDWCFRPGLRVWRLGHDRP